MIDRSVIVAISMGVARLYMRIVAGVSLKIAASRGALSMSYSYSTSNQSAHNYLGLS
jgi:hypothetical protein